MSEYFHEYDARGKSFGHSDRRACCAVEGKTGGHLTACEARERKSEHNEGDKWGPKKQRRERDLLRC